jgi:hypothetical protein
MMRTFWGELVSTVGVNHIRGAVCGAEQGNILIFPHPMRRGKQPTSKVGRKYNRFSSITFGAVRAMCSPHIINHVARTAHVNIRFLIPERDFSPPYPFFRCKFRCLRLRNGKNSYWISQDVICIRTSLCQLYLGVILILLNFKWSSRQCLVPTGR